MKLKLSPVLVLGEMNHLCADGEGEGRKATADVGIEFRASQAVEDDGARRRFSASLAGSTARTRAASAVTTKDAFFISRASFRPIGSVARAS